MCSRLTDRSWGRVRSPPFGPAAFYLKGVAPPSISLQDIYRALWPFMLLQVLALAIVIAFPEIALWLPKQLQANPDH
ncbi:MAG: TRAP transporter large permease subunit [Granulosicoccus sp.]|nr:TRAP transporter large permease subunit [Granulosicoccus sp.]